MTTTYMHRLYLKRNVTNVFILCIPRSSIAVCHYVTKMSDPVKHGNHQSLMSI